jgi:hypothetical protein
MAARAAAGRDAAACFGRSAAVASVRAMVKQGGSETAENDGSKLLNVAQLRCQRSLPGRGCYLACRRGHPDPPPLGMTETSLFLKETKNMCTDSFRKSQDELVPPC